VYQLADAIGAPGTIDLAPRTAIEKNPTHADNKKPYALLSQTLILRSIFGIRDGYSPAINLSQNVALRHLQFLYYRYFKDTMGYTENLNCLINIRIMSYGCTDTAQQAEVILTDLKPHLRDILSGNTSGNERKFMLD